MRLCLPYLSENDKKRFEVQLKQEEKFAADKLAADEKKAGKNRLKKGQIKSKRKHKKVNEEGKTASPDNVVTDVSDKKHKVNMKVNRD